MWQLAIILNIFLLTAKQKAKVMGPWRKMFVAQTMTKVFVKELMKCQKANIG